MDNSLKTKDLHHTAADLGKRDDNKTQSKTPDTLRQGASQAAGAASRRHTRTCAGRHTRSQTRETAVGSTVRAGCYRSPCRGMP